MINLFLIVPLYLDAMPTPKKKEITAKKKKNKIREMGKIEEREKYWKQREL